MLDPPIVPGEDGLIQPTRARLFALLGDLARPAGTAELAERLGLHPNGVRAHLERMRGDGLLVRERDRRPRGRPRDAWSVSPDADPGGNAPSAYGDLARWLARSMRSDTADVEQIEACGRQIGRELAGRRSGSEEQQLQSALSALGFKPRLERRGQGRLGVVLRNCPYREAVRENQPLICAMHRGITRGLLDRISPHGDVAAFAPHDPDTAGCVVELTGIGGGEP
ncbi:MAG TPA: helix-turn-helix domain-containing protein [Solirubrobacteraceae bacterium]|jgi:predicted ArsR family transcriptional regulator